MANTILGIDIGSCTLKLALCRGSDILKLAEEHMPDNLVHDGRVVSAEALSEFIKASLKKNRIRARRCAVILPASQVFVRQTELPAMTDEELHINLPYEFRDFITDERDKYFYDYYVISTENGENGQPVKMTLMTAAAAKELISQYNDLCRWAGLKLVTAVPAEMALVNLIRRAQAESAKPADAPKKAKGKKKKDAADATPPEAAVPAPGGDEQCFIDLGHSGTRIFFFQGDRFDAVRSAELGGQSLDNALSEALGVDPHIALTRKEANTDGELDSPEAAELFRSISTEIMRAVNFYSYNNPGSDLSLGWFCGGGSRISALCGDIAETLNISLAPITGLIPGSPEDALSGVCYAAIGAAMQ